MDKAEFSDIRQSMGKTQKQMAQLLGTSLKAVQSFEQGWRNIPAYIERQMLFLIAMKSPSSRASAPCWVIQHCPDALRQECPAWELQIGHLCWFINGTICRGEAQVSWPEKMKICRECKVFRALFPGIKAS
jgi:hypothetical protein